jgi:repressor LexA
MSYLTERQREVLRFIEGTVTERGVAPTLREIAERFGFSSTASAQKHVGLLEKKGFLRRVKHQKRGLVLEHEQQVVPGEGIQVRLLGVVAAGSPIESIADEENIAVPEDMVRSGEHFALKVRGDSMIEDGIHDGDLVVVQRKSTAHEGEMVVALVDGEVTLKRLYRHGPEELRLQPSNINLPPLVVADKQVQVQGAVVGLLRRY